MNFQPLTIFYHFRSIFTTNASERFVRETVRVSHLMSTRASFPFIQENFQTTSCDETERSASESLAKFLKRNLMIEERGIRCEDRVDRESPQSELSSGIYANP